MMLELVICNDCGDFEKHPCNPYGLGGCSVKALPKTELAWPLQKRICREFHKAGG